jgi:hypothetical protein
MSTNLSATADGRGLAAANDALARHQSLLAEWLRLQTAQLRVTERFLESQDRLLSGHAALPLLTIPSEAAVQPEPPATGLAPVRVAPAPLAPAGSRPPVAVPPLRRMAASSTVASTIDVPAVVPSPPPAAAAPAASAAPAARQGSDGRAVAARPVVSDVVPTVSAEVDPAAIPPTEEFRSDLLQAVSERTGYPLDMLDEDLPLESGLGIDSIKAVEIFGSLKRYQSLWRRDGEVQDIGDEFNRPKTLREIVAGYDEFRKRKNGEPAGPAAKEKAKLAGPTAASRRAAEGKAAVGRYAVETEEAPLEAVSSRPFRGAT